MTANKPIGVFDSGYGGLTVLKELVNKMPQYDYLYLGDNARAPYGTRSFEVVYQYTLQCVKWFFKQECPLVVLACNTASAKALRTIQQKDLPKIDPDKRVLGVIRPTAEVVGNFTKTGNIGILGTNGTVQSDSYPIEIKKFFPGLKVFQQACPLWVPLVESNEYSTEGADYFIREGINQLLNQCEDIDTILLACTHYPLLLKKIRQFAPGRKIISQGEIIADSLKDYLERHPEIEEKCGRTGQVDLFTTDTTDDFDRHSSEFFGKKLKSRQIKLE
ncbi:MAG TPA: glutamate racemase [Chitinophagaceae bacterium]|nr:glutamate racemase [Chitinophagaceae bacterium]